MQHVAVIGSGSWGTRAGRASGAASVTSVTLWGRDASLVAEMRQRRANPIYLPDIVVSGRSRRRPTISGDGAADGVGRGRGRSFARRPCGRDADGAAVCVPGALVVSAVKGIEAAVAAADDRGARARSCRRRARWRCFRGRASRSSWRARLPTAVVVASTSPATVEHVQAEFRSPVAAPLRHGGRDRRGDRRRAEEHDCHRGRRGRGPRARGTTRWPRSSRAGSPSSRGWRWRWAASARRSRGSPGLATWC